MIFNGIEKDYLIPLTGRRRSAWAPVSRVLVTVPGMVGAYLSRTETQIREIVVPVIINAENIENLQKIKEDLTEWLVHDEPKELIFKDEPDRVYYAVVDGELELDEIFSTGQGEITFICPDPYKYGPEKNVETTSDTFNVENNGTADAEPIITLTAKEPTTFAMVSNGEKYMMVGRPYDINEQPFEKYEQVFYTNADSLVGWTTASNSDIGSGIVAGNMISRNGRFVAESYGTGSNWHGPAIKTSLPEVIEDFRMKVNATLWNGSPPQIGKIEVYLLDSLGNAVCKIALKDISNVRANIHAELRAGDSNDGYFIISEHGDRPGVWNNFSGQIIIEREGNEWYAYVGMVDSTGRHHTRRARRWTDTDNKYTNSVSQVVVHMGAYNTNPPLSEDSGVSEILIEKINNEPDGVPYIANPDDQIIFEHKTRDVYINGESVPFEFGADFFTLKKGVNTLTVLPENTFETSVKYRERYK